VDNLNGGEDVEPAAGDDRALALKVEIHAPLLLPDAPVL
jgi:hypothetical protein